MMDKFWKRRYEDAEMSLPDQDQTIALIRRLQAILSQYPVNIQMAAIGARKWAGHSHDATGKFS